ncbi:MAG: energy-coupling factor ABC transporter permease [Anaerovoracaceae bacterium]
MHLASEWVSPITGGMMMAVSAGAVVYSAVKLKEKGMDDQQIGLMGAAGAFVFASQMVDVAIPFTGSSGHIGGGLLLAALLGPHGAFLALTAVLLVQAFVFSDGGLMALGCNIFNMGICTCYIAYPLIFKPILKKRLTYGRIGLASILASVAGLQLGAFAVALETKASNLNTLPFLDFVSKMQPIHLAIGLMEGLIMAGVLTIVYATTPQIIENPLLGKTISAYRTRQASIGFLLWAAIIGGGFSLLASDLPDGLEWAIKQSSVGPAAAGTWLHSALEGMQSKMAFMADYGFAGGGEALGTIASGAVGIFLTLLIIVVTTGFIGMGSLKNGIKE